MKRILGVGLSFLGILALTAGGYEAVKSASSIQYLDVIRNVKRRHGLESAPDGLTLATIETESSFVAGAIRKEPQINDASYGLMQILYGTAKQMGYSGDPEGLFDPETNIRYATAYQVWLYNRYHDWNAVIHSYNEGPGNYDKGKRVPTYFGRVYARWGKWDLMLSASGDISA